MDWEADAAAGLERVTAGGIAADLGKYSGKKDEGVPKTGELSGLKTPQHEVRVCGGAAGCPLSLADDRALSLALAGVLNLSGLDRKNDGTIKFHQKFRVAVSGCPNSCSQPQIVDFGVVGQSTPGRGDGSCTGCGQCAGVCSEKAIRMLDDGPVFDYSRCQNCGQCIGSCPTEAIREVERGYRVLAGGKLGRHPRLAGVILELADEERVKAILERALRLYTREGLAGERFSAMVERLGMDRVKEILVDK